MQSKAFEWADFIEKVLRRAGKEVLQIRNDTRFKVSYKHAGEIVSTADLASDRIIREAISQSYPDHRILSEELVNGEIEKLSYEGPLWIIDPLDGTVNFSKRLPHFAISAAIAVDGVVWSGVVHAPELGVTYKGIKGKGSECNSKRLQINPIGSLSTSIVGTGFPHDKKKVQKAIERVNVLSNSCGDIRRLAAPAVDIC